jgi:hypothetical protein
MLRCHPLKVDLATGAVNVVISIILHAETTAKIAVLDVLALRVRAVVMVAVVVATVVAMVAAMVEVVGGDNSVDLA